MLSLANAKMDDHLVRSGAGERWALSGYSCSRHEIMQCPQFKGISDLGDIYAIKKNECENWKLFNH